MNWAVPPVLLGASEPISLPSFIPNPETGLLLRIACRNRQSSAVASTAGAALTAAGAAGAGKPFCRQPKGKAFFKAPAISGSFSWISRNLGSSGLEKAGFRESRPQTFPETQDCSNPEPNTSGSDKIAAILLQTFWEVTGLQQSGAPARPRRIWRARRSPHRGPQEVFPRTIAGNPMNFRKPAPQDINQDGQGHSLSPRRQRQGGQTDKTDTQRLIYRTSDILFSKSETAN